MKKWEHEIVSKARYSYNIDYETKRIAHLILDREEKLLDKQLNALEYKRIALEYELAKTKIHISELKAKKDMLKDYE